MNGPLIDAAKRILKRRYGVECTEPFAGVDRFRRTTGNSVAQVDLESWRKSSAYKLSLCGFCYDNDETYEGESKVKMTEFTNPTDVAELIDEQLSKVETNLHILIKMHRPYSKKKRILNFGEAKELLESAGFSVISEENVQLSDKFRTAWNGIMQAMSNFTNWNRVVMWYAGDKYEKKATTLSEAYARGQYSLREIIEKMKSAGSQWYKDLLSEIDAILKKNHLKVTGDREEFSYGDKSYKIVPVCNSVGSKCSFEIRENSDAGTPQIHYEEDVFKRTPFTEDPDEALDELEALIDQEF